MSVILIGTLDTKGAELQFVRDYLGADVTLVIDAGVLGSPSFAADVPRERVFAAAGTTLAAVQQLGDRGRAIEAAARGVVAVARELHAQGKIQGILALG